MSDGFCTTDEKLLGPVHRNEYVPALVGVANETDLKKFEHIEFVKTPQMIVTYTIEQNQNQNDQKVQPVLG